MHLARLRLVTSTNHLNTLHSSRGICCHCISGRFLDKFNERLHPSGTSLCNRYSEIADRRAPSVSRSTARSRSPKQQTASLTSKLWSLSNVVTCRTQRPRSETHKLFFQFRSLSFRIPQSAKPPSFASRQPAASNKVLGFGWWGLLAHA